jgi:dienelactone hydrolase
LHSRIVLALFALCACFSSACAVAQAASFRFLEKPGPYAVGLRVVNQYDRSRSFPVSADQAKPSERNRPRPLQTLVWYPSSASTARPMTVGDYAQLADTEIRFDVPDRSNKWRSILTSSSTVPLRAVRDAPSMHGHFPVVIYAPGDSSVSWDNADLCEYLASHGYVVLASPSMGASTRDMTDDLAGIGTQARDISFLIGYAETLPDADPSKVAVAAWSWGGISSLFAAARDRRINALVDLEGSIRYYPGLVQRAGDVRPGRMTLPLLFFTRGDLSLEDWDGFNDDGKIGPSVLNQWIHGDLLTVHMLGMSHPEFSAMTERKHNAERFAENQQADYDRDDANTSYAWIARYAVAFLDVYLKRDAAADAFLKKTPAENGVPRHFMATSFRPAKREVSPSHSGTVSGP